MNERTAIPQTSADAQPDGAHSALSTQHSPLIDSFGRLHTLTRRDGLEQVLAGIDAAQAAGFGRIKLNAVILRGVNEADVVPLARYARGRGLELRFIEYMPIGAEVWEREKVLFAHE